MRLVTHDSLLTKLTIKLHAFPLPDLFPHQLYQPLEQLKRLKPFELEVRMIVLRVAFL